MKAEVAVRTLPLSLSRKADADEAVPMDEEPAPVAAPVEPVAPPAAPVDPAAAVGRTMATDGESKADRLEKLNPAHGRTRAPSVETVAAGDATVDIVDPSRVPSMHGTEETAPQTTAALSSTETTGVGGKAVWSPGSGGGGRKRDWSSRKDPCDNCCNCCCDGIKDTWCACPGAAWLNIVSVLLLMLCMFISSAIFFIHSVPVIPAIINIIGGDTFKLGECPGSAQQL